MTVCVLKGEACSDYQRNINQTQQLFSALLSLLSTFLVVLNFWPTAILVKFGVFFICSRQLLANMLCVASCTPPAQRQPTDRLISGDQTRA